MRRPEWTWLALAAGACAGPALLIGRAESAAVWTVLPLMVWLLAASRVSGSGIAAAVQVAVIIGVAAAASGHLGVGPLSFWDAALAYDITALIACVGAWYAYPATTPGRGGIPGPRPAAAGWPGPSGS